MSDTLARRTARYTRLLDKFRAAEQDLVRASRKWDRLRLSVRRAEKAMDREFNAAAPQADLRQLGAVPVHCVGPEGTGVLCGDNDAAFVFSACRFSQEPLQCRNCLIAYNLSLIAYNLST